MAEIDRRLSVTVNNRRRRWNSLIQLAELLSQGEVQLEDLANEVQDPPYDDSAGTILDRTTSFVKRGRRSSRRKNPNTWIKAAAAAAADAVATTQQMKKHAQLELGLQTCSSSNPNFTRKPEKGSQRLILLRVPNAVVVGPAPPEAVKNQIVGSGGCLESVVFLIEKKLHATDLNRSENRVSLPRRQLRNEFLESNERELLESSTAGFPARLIEPCLNECTVTFCLWKSNGMYAFKTSWYDVCKRNELNDRTIVRVWSFRRKSELCFAMIKKLVD